MFYCRLKAARAHTKAGYFFADSGCHLNAKYARACVDVVGWRGLRLREVVGDEVGTLEEQEYIAEAVALQGTVQSDPVGILKDTHTHTHTHTRTVF